MFNLLDIMRAAQGGAAIDGLARQFGIPVDQTQQAVAAMLPAFAMGLQRNAGQPNAFAHLLQMLSSGQYNAFYDNPGAAFSPQGRDSGADALAQMFGSPELARRVAEQTATLSGIAVESAGKMLPVVAAMLMGGMAKQASDQGLTGAFERYAQMMSGGAAPQPAPPPQSNPWQDMIGAMLGGAVPQSAGAQAARDAEQRASTSANPWEDMMTAMLGGSKPPEPPPAPERPTDAAFDAYAQMVQSGREMHDQHLAALKSMFDSFWGKQAP